MRPVGLRPDTRLPVRFWLCDCPSERQLALGPRAGDRLCPGSPIPVFVCVLLGEGVKVFCTLGGA